jgi:hypothetical protein
MLTDTSPTSRMVRRSPFPEVLIKKLNQFGYGNNTREDTHHKSGRLSTPTLWVMKLIERRDK